MWGFQSEKNNNIIRNIVSVTTITLEINHIHNDTLSCLKLTEYFHKLSVSSLVYEESEAIIMLSCRQTVHKNTV